MTDTALQAWRRWWDDEGSAMRPLPNEDTEQFARRMTEIAWSNGAFKRLADVDLLRAELVAMRRQRDEAQRDAERYRWLKSKGCDWITIYRHPSGDEFFDGKANERMDERIDGARSRDEKGGGA